MGDPQLYETLMVPLESPRGATLAASMSDGWAARCSHLISCYEPQVHGAWCALASTVIALRALGFVDVPSQQQLFDRHIAALGGMRNGISLTQLDTLLSSLVASTDVAVSLRVGHESTELAQTLHTDLLTGEADDSVLLVNFLRLLGGQWTGHCEFPTLGTQAFLSGWYRWLLPAWSDCLRPSCALPAGSIACGLGFEEGPGSEPFVLILDVAAHKVSTPHWVPLGTLAQCICTRNRFGEARGCGCRLLSSPPAPFSTEPGAVASWVIEY